MFGKGSGSDKKQAPEKKSESYTPAPKAESYTPEKKEGYTVSQKEK